MKSSKAWLAALLKFIWCAAVILFVSIYLYRNFDMVLLVTKQVTWERIVLALTALTAGKICLAINMKYSLLLIDRHFSFKRCFHIYNISQLGKYIPGNFWHFLGRIGFYKNLNLSLREIRSSMLLEIVFIIIGSFFFGLIFLLFSPEFLNIFSERYPASKSILLYTVLVSIFVAGIMTIVKGDFVKKKLRIIYDKRNLNAKMLIVQFIIWLFFGISFFLIISPSTLEIGTLAFATGLFSLAYLIGFLFIIAPAGIGIREFVLISGLSMVNIPTGMAISLVGLHRLLYIIVEIFLAGIGMLLFSSHFYGGKK